MSKTAEFEALYKKAHNAGMAALNEVTPNPMVVHEMVGLTNQVKQSYFVSEGACGFAWVNVKPGNCSFANWLKKRGKGRTDSYYGGVTIWVSEGNQSIERKEKYAKAMVQVFKEAGVKCYAASRLD